MEVAMEFVERMVSKFKLDRFFNSKLVLAIDLFVSLSASICTLIFVKVMLSSVGLTVPFIMTWLGLSLGFSLLYFFVFKTYRTIIRHSTLKEFAKIVLASFMKSLSVVLLMLVLPFADTYYLSTIIT